MRLTRGNSATFEESKMECQENGLQIIWFRFEASADAMRVEVKGLEVARLLWDVLSKAGWYMASARP